ncbi:MAG: carbohydrate ABC transporter substrate-binding protein [Lachnospiraceae bacterium]|nr:carbohydrate ABC transporter substrate-binding protein [Lachnospiraceae bacterium]
MRRRIKLLLLWMLATAFLHGCGGENHTGEGQEVSGANGEFTSEEPSASGEDLFFQELLLEEETWRDNSLDAYSATASFPLKPQEVGIVGGAREYALGSTCGAVFKKHLFESLEECWDELKTVTDQGGENSVRLAFRDDTHNQAWGIGSIMGSDHFMMWDFVVAEDAEKTYQFFEVDGQQQILRRISIDFLADDGGESPSHILVDQEGNIHFTTCYIGSQLVDDSKPSKTCYIIADAEGELLFKGDCSGNAIRLVSLYDGRVGLLSQLTDSQGRRTGSRLEYVDPGTGETVLLAEFGEDAPKALWRTENCYYTLWDEKTLLFADNKGLHLADLAGNATEDLYLWSNHGIGISQIEELQIREDGRVNLIYTDNNGDGNLLCLEPTREQVEIRKIVFAVPSAMREVYYPTVVAFNKKYPAYHIELKTDYDRTALLTELAAGRGPVLVDTMLTGFEGNQKLWTPLEGLFAGEAWEEALIPKAMELGEIDGTLYGVVYSFGLQTVVIPKEEPTDWDYKTFLDLIEADSSIQAIYNGQNSPWIFISNFLLHGLEDNYVLDAGSGETYFDSEEFRRVLRLGMKYCTEQENIESVEPMLEGKVFCNIIDVRRPELIDLYRLCYGEEANYIGFPAREGAAHYIYGQDPLAVRITATDEEKRVAGTFLRMLLSEEGQTEGMKDPNFWLSVRKDVLEEQIAQVNEQSMPTIYGFTQITLGEDYDREYDARFLYELLEKARPRKYFPKDLNTILIEEVYAYTDGTITEEELIKRLTRRVELYLAEQS